MYFYEKKIDDIPETNKAFTKAVDAVLNNGYKHNILATDSISVTRNLYKDSMNMSDIQTKLIQLTGRYCERYASDLICTLSDLQAFIEVQYSPEPMRKTIIVGIREDGVDHEAFVVPRLEDTITGMNGYVHVDWVYRKLLAIDIQDEVKGEFGYPYMERTVRLVDITHEVSRLEKSEAKTEKEKTVA